MINVPTREQVSPNNQLIFDQLKSKLGKVPNLYATLAYSEHALESYLAGWTLESLVDVVVAIGDRTVTNYLHGTTRVPVDFPAVPKLPG